MRNIKINVILSARDPAAAIAIKNIVTSECFRRFFNPHLILQGAARNYFCGDECFIKKIDDDFSSIEEIENIAIDFIKEVQPKSIIVGSSGPDCGVDEVLLMASGNIKSYVVQDYWGDVNLGLGFPADCYFVLDDYAQKLTKKRVDSDVYVTGSVKHYHYVSVDLKGIKEKRHFRLGVLDTEKVIGFFGMPLGFLDGYWDTIKCFCEAIPDKGYKVIYRPHPKESGHDIERTMRLFGERACLESGVSVEESILICDYVVSCYSSCGVDSELLSFFFDDTRLSVFLLFNDEVRTYYSKYAGIDDIPISAQGRAVTIFEEARLSDLWGMSDKMISSLSVREGQMFSPKDSVYRLVNKICSDLKGFF